MATMGLYDRDYMRRARTDAEERTGRPAWLESTPGRACTSRGLWGALVSLALCLAVWHWHLLTFVVHR
jgi:hypothetical protein